MISAQLVTSVKLIILVIILMNTFIISFSNKALGINPLVLIPLNKMRSLNEKCDIFVLSHDLSYIIIIFQSVLRSCYTLVYIINPVLSENRSLLKSSTIKVHFNVYLLIF